MARKVSSGKSPGSAREEGSVRLFRVVQLRCIKQNLQSCACSAFPCSIMQNAVK